MTPADHLQDERARERISTALDECLIVEAGAGSGKTTKLVDRIVALIARGTPVDAIAAVTFTRKAASELRERLQEKLEKALREGTEPAESLARYDRARRDLDRAFLGTIHSFCARLLRERPLEAGLDPAFEELDELGLEEAREGFWRRWLAEEARNGNGDLAALQAVGIDPRDLREAFAEMVCYPDVEFPTIEVAAPDHGPCRRALEALVARATKMLPATEPEPAWDKLQSTVRRLAWHRQVIGWGDRVQFLAEVAALSESRCDIVQKRWPVGKDEVKGLAADFVEFLTRVRDPLLRQWYEHRYPLVVRVLRAAAESFSRERRETGRLAFEDLLLATAGLLRENPGARRELGARWAHLLVDEFQDTDPIQAEVCLLLASDPSDGNDWRTVVPRPGSLFVVGDPKQSIYRFRRADIQVYNAVKARFEQFGEVLYLTRNFRSVNAIGALVNAHFAAAFSADERRAAGVQASFSSLLTQRDASGADGVFRYGIAQAGTGGKERLWADDSAMLAAWIEARIAAGRMAGDFMILTPYRKEIAVYARALAQRNIAVTTTGAALPQELELRELRVVLSALADPDNGVLVAAALEGYFFGLSPAQLYEASRSGLRFSIAHTPSEKATPAGAALAQLNQWWIISQRHPADVVLETILDETGLLAYAASQELGDIRAGALLHIVEALRSFSGDGATGIVDALDRLDVLLSSEAPDVPLRPGREDAVRIMNIHKAKGLEGKVVILAAPSPQIDFAPTKRIVRAEDGSSRGWIQFTAPSGRDSVVLAQPPEWEEVHAPAEQAFVDAERTRVLYVAATRAEQELVVSESRRSTKKDGLQPCESPWAPLSSARRQGETSTITVDITEHLQQALAARAATQRRKLERRANEVVADAELAVASLHAAEEFTHRITTVTESAKRQLEVRRSYDLAEPKGLGASWGRAVHRSLEGALRGRRGPALDAWIRVCAREEELDAGQAAELQRVVDRAMASDAWNRLTGAGKSVAELPVMYVRGADGVEHIVEGVIDAGAKDEHGWVIVDWKTDRVSDGEWEKRRSGYEDQVRQYTEILEALSGSPGKGSIERLSG